MSNSLESQSHGDDMKNQGVLLAVFVLQTKSFGAFEEVHQQIDKSCEPLNEMSKIVKRVIAPKKVHP